MQIHVHSEWSPILAVAIDGNRKVLQVIGWAGTTGISPAVNLYIGTTGYTTDITQAVNIAINVGGVGQTFIINETLTGAINGTNKVFTTNYQYIPGSTKVYMNGLSQKKNSSYTETSGTIVFDVAPKPNLFGDCELTIDYIQN